MLLILGKFLLKGNVYDFSIEYDAIDKAGAVNIYKYSTVKNNIRITLWRMKQVFIELLGFGGTSTTKCVSLSNKHAWLGLLLLI